MARTARRVLVAAITVTAVVMIARPERARQSIETVQVTPIVVPAHRMKIDRRGACGIAVPRLVSSRAAGGATASRGAYVYEGCPPVDVYQTLEYVSASAYVGPPILRL